MGWSSLFWAAILGVFLVIQAANLASDLRSYPPPGVLVEVPITLADGGKSEMGKQLPQHLAIALGAAAALVYMPALTLRGW